MAENEIYGSLDFFQPTDDYQVNNDLIEYFYTLKKMAESNPLNQEYKGFKFLTTIMDLFLFECQPQKKDNVMEKSLKLVQKFKPMGDTLAIEVSKIMVVAVCYSGDVQSSERKGQKDNQEENVYYKINISKDQFVHIQALKNLRRAKKQMRRISIDQLKSQFSKEEDKISEFNSLPLPFIVEFIDGIRNILSTRRDKFFIKMNQFLNFRVSKLQSDNSSPL